MYLGYTYIKQWHQRLQKATHRRLQIFALICDNCHNMILKSSSELNKSQRNGYVKHYCGLCGDVYKLAQKDSALRKRTLKHDASSTVSISSLR